MSTTCANNMNQGKRRKLEELSACEIEPLEALFTDRWPEVWREIARSCYLTLLALPATSRQDNAELSMLIAEGLGADLGGSQPYIPVGGIKDWDARKNRVLEMLARGDGYKSVARECGLTESRVRRIESDQRRKRVPLAQRIAIQQTKDQP